MVYRFTNIDMPEPSKANRDEMAKTVTTTLSGSYPMSISSFFFNLKYMVVQSRDTSETGIEMINSIGMRYAKSIVPGCRRYQPDEGFAISER